MRLWSRWLVNHHDNGVFHPIINTMRTRTRWILAAVLLAVLALLLVWLDVQYAVHKSDATLPAQGAAP